MRSINEAVRFLLEICVLVAVGMWAWSLAAPVLRWLAVISGPLAVASIWGRWVAPRSPRRLDDPSRLVVEGVVFVIGTTALLAVASPGVAITFAGVAVANIALMFFWKQR